MALDVAYFEREFAADSVEARLVFALRYVGHDVVVVQLQTVRRAGNDEVKLTYSVRNDSATASRRTGFFYGTLFSLC